MKVLLSAYSCLPGEGSEPGIGWNWARNIDAYGHDVVVITRAVNKKRIETFVEHQSVGAIRFAFHDLAPIVQRLYKLPLGNYMYYLLWQYTATQLALELHRTEGFDRVHHITWGSFRVPSFMGRLGIPFTFGPVGGGEDTPKGLRPGLGWRGRFWDAMRRLSNAAMLPLVGFTFATATEIVATTAETLSKVPARYRHKATIRQAIGIDMQDTLAGSQKAQRRHEPHRTSRLELLYVGRLLPWKGIHLLLKALALLGGNKSNIHLTVIGSGTDLTRLQRLSSRLNLEAAVSWIPSMPREELLQNYSRFDLFAFPSLHDSGGIAVLEALTFGLPVVCLDLGGPRVTVNESCGRVVSTTGAREDVVVSSIAQFLNEILMEPSKLILLSRAARDRAARCTWKANVDSIYSSSTRTQENRLEGVSIAEI